MSATYTVFDEESESEVKNAKNQAPEGKNKIIYFELYPHLRKKKGARTRAHLELAVLFAVAYCSLLLAVRCCWLFAVAGCSLLLAVRYRLLFAVACCSLSLDVRCRLLFAVACCVIIVVYLKLASGEDENDDSKLAKPYVLKGQYIFYCINSKT